MCVAQCSGQKKRIHVLTFVGHCQSIADGARVCWMWRDAASRRKGYKFRHALDIAGVLPMVLGYVGHSSFQCDGRGRRKPCNAR